MSGVFRLQLLARARSAISLKGGLFLKPSSRLTPESIGERIPVPDGRLKLANYSSKHKFSEREEGVRLFYYHYHFHFSDFYV